MTRKYKKYDKDLKALRGENAKLRMENEILKKATAYFAKDVL